MRCVHTGHTNTIQHPSWGLMPLNMRVKTQHVHGNMKQSPSLAGNPEKLESIERSTELGLRTRIRIQLPSSLSTYSKWIKWCPDPSGKPRRRSLDLCGWTRPAAPRNLPWFEILSSVISVRYQRHAKNGRNSEIWTFDILDICIQMGWIKLICI